MLYNSSLGFQPRKPRLRSLIEKQQSQTHGNNMVRNKFYVQGERQIIVSLFQKRELQKRRDPRRSQNPLLMNDGMIELHKNVSTLSPHGWKTPPYSHNCFPIQKTTKYSSTSSNTIHNCRITIQDFPNTDLTQ